MGTISDIISMNFLGAWNASTNTPTLSDTTASSVDLSFYRVSVAGTQNLGSGSISWAVGQIVFSQGGVWKTLGGAGGTTSYKFISENATGATAANNAPFKFTGTGSIAGTIPYDAATGKFTLTSGITYFLEASVITLAGNVQFVWYDQTNSVAIGNGAGTGLDSGTSASLINGIASATVTPITDIEVTVLNISGGPRSLDQTGANAVHSFAKVVQLGTSASVAVSGQSVDFIRAQKTTDQTGITTATDILFQTQVGNIPFDGIAFTLTAGKTYELTAFLTNTNASGNSAQFKWVNSSDVALPNQNTGQTKSPTGTDNGGAYIPAHTIYTPTVTDFVHVKVTATSGTMGIAGVVNVTDNGNSFAVIKQLGSSDVITNPNPNPIVTRFTSGGTYFPTSGMTYAIIEMTGGGGAGGGAPATTATTQGSVGAAGAGSGYVKFMATAAQIGVSKSVTIGTGGVGASGGTGGTGGTSVFGNLASVTGGTGGAVAGPTLVAEEVGSTASGSVVTLTIGTLIESRLGQRGGSSATTVSTTIGFTVAGAGGATPLGVGFPVSTSIGVANLTGLAASTDNFGCGGSGSASSGSIQAVKTGINGEPGIVIITEYFQ